MQSVESRDWALQLQYNYYAVFYSKNENRYNLAVNLNFEAMVSISELQVVNILVTFLQEYVFRD